MGKFVFDNTDFHKFFNDFDAYVAANWTVTETGSGSRALTNVDGGCLLVTNAAADNDLNQFQLAVESFKFETGKILYFEARVKLSDVTQSDFFMGLSITDTSLIVSQPTDAIYFGSDDGDALLDFHIGKNGTYTDSTGVATLVNDTFVRLAFYYDGVAMQVLVDDVVVAKPVLTNICDDEELAVSFCIMNGEAVAKTLTIDYIFCAKER